MLHVDKCSRTAVFLSFCNTVQCQSSFTGRFRSVYFYNSTSWQTADAKGKIQRQRACRNCFYLQSIFLTETHNGTFSELFFNLCQCSIQRFAFIYNSHNFLHICISMCLIIVHVFAKINGFHKFSKQMFGFYFLIPATTRMIFPLSFSNCICSIPAFENIRATSVSCPSPISTATIPPVFILGIQISAIAR